MSTSYAPLSEVGVAGAGLSAGPGAGGDGLGVLALTGAGPGTLVLAVTGAAMCVAGAATALFGRRLQVRSDVASPLSDLSDRRPDPND